MTTQRKEFEAWIARDGGDLSTFGKGENLHYANSAVNNAWTGWQAATRQAQPKTVPISEDAKRLGLNFCCGIDEKRREEIDKLRNVIQSAFIANCAEAIVRWNQLFPGHQHPGIAPKQAQGEPAGQVSGRCGGLVCDPVILQQGEPVAWRYTPSDAWVDTIVTQDPNIATLAREHGREVTPLYTHQPDDTALLRQALEALDAVSAGAVSLMTIDAARFELKKRLDRHPAIHRED